MKVVQYLKEHGIAKLISEFSIKVKEYPEGLLVLGYDQIESPKAHPIVMECRGLILDKNFNVVSRGFDRFFNYGEQPDTQAHIDWSKAVCVEKVDGSLIKIYNWNGHWCVSTRGTAFAESTVNGFPLTFKDLVFKALEIQEHGFQLLCDSHLDPDYTYVFEVTATENRVVKVYEGYKLHYLGARNNKTFEYGNSGHEFDALVLGARTVRRFKFSTAEECIETAKHLKDLDEGYVLWQDGRPVCKIKSPAYVAVHHIRGEGLNPKRISQIVLTGETDEYLKYFPEDAAHFEPYVKAKVDLMNAMYGAWSSSRDIEEQKAFALTVKDFPFSAVLFQTRQRHVSGVPASVFSTFNEAREDYQIKLLAAFVQ